MKKIYQKPQSQVVELETLSMLAASIRVAEDEVDANDSYSNKRQPTSGPWSGKLWDEME